jgi:hypothetical protein
MLLFGNLSKGLERDKSCRRCFHLGFPRFFAGRKGGEVQIATRQGEREHVLLCLFCISLSHSFFGILGGSNCQLEGREEGICILHLRLAIFTLVLFRFAGRRIKLSTRGCGVRKRLGFLLISFCSHLVFPTREGAQRAAGTLLLVRKQGGYHRIDWPFRSHSGSYLALS